MNKYELSTCVCGAPNTQLCGDGVKGLIPCPIPVCKHGCPKHRHQKGTMGYPDWKTAVAVWQGLEPDTAGVWPLLEAWFSQRFASPQALAERAWKDVCKQFPRPAPVPALKLTVKGITFLCTTQEGVQYLHAEQTEDQLDG